MDDAAANACKCIDLLKSSVLHRVCGVSKTKIDLERRQADVLFADKMNWWHSGHSEVHDLDVVRESFDSCVFICHFANMWFQDVPRISHWDPVLSCSECCCSEMFSIQRDSCTDPQFWNRSVSFSISIGGIVPHPIPQLGPILLCCSQGRSSRPREPQDITRSTSNQEWMWNGYGGFQK